MEAELLHLRGFFPPFFVRVKQLLTPADATTPMAAEEEAVLWGVGKDGGAGVGTWSAVHCRR